MTRGDVTAAWTWRLGSGVAPGIPERAAELVPGVTVAVCTAGRPDAVRRCLASLARQRPAPDAVVVVDGSRDRATEEVVRESWSADAASSRRIYVRVAETLRGLTRQRNVALDQVSTDRVAFFDDDVVADPDCLAEMAASFDAAGDRIVGVGAYIENQRREPDLRWRARRWLGIVGDLTPGRYHRSGMSTPWGFLAPTTDLVDGDWLPGCAMMWRTEPARAVRFREAFTGYAQGEDLDFSLRMRRWGRLVVSGRAVVRHLHHASGRLGPFESGYHGLRNRYEIHRTCLVERRPADTAWFLYAWSVDAVLHLIGAVREGRLRERALFVGGLARGVWDILLPPRSSPSVSEEHR